MMDFTPKHAFLIEDEDDIGMTRKTNELKKKDGHWVQLRNGWKAEVYDNLKGNTRLCKVYGDFTEIGSVYAHDIIAWGNKPGQIHWPIQHTEAQLKLKKHVEAMSV